MAEPTDHELLTEFARTGAEHAFAALVARHINLVYSAARRFTSDDTLAGDITQAVFILLARKAGGISARVILTGWLYQTARLTAANTLKKEFHRQKREQEACMQSILTSAETDDAWKQLAPALDDAMGTLRETDRNAVLLRFFQNKPLAEVGIALGVSEDAARVRITRAVDKLRQLLSKKGITLGATAITGAVAANAVSAAPAALATTITATLTGTTLTLTAVAMTTIQKIAVTAALTLTLGAGVYQAKQAGDARAELQALQAQQAPMAGQIQELETQLGMMTNKLLSAQTPSSPVQTSDPELLKLRGEVGVLKQQALDAQQKLSDLLSAEKQLKKLESTKVNTAKQAALGMIMFAYDNNGHFPTDFQQTTNYLGGYDKLMKMNVYDFDLTNIGADGQVDGLNPTNLLASAHPDLLVLRERRAWQSPDGSWNRIYGYLDGRVVTATTYDGNFAAWEKVNSYVPPTPAGQ